MESAPELRIDESTPSVPHDAPEWANREKKAPGCPIPPPVHRLDIHRPTASQLTYAQIAVRNVRNSNIHTHTVYKSLFYYESEERIPNRVVKLGKVGK